MVNQNYPQFELGMVQLYDANGHISSVALSLRERKLDEPATAAFAILTGAAAAANFCYRPTRPTRPAFRRTTMSLHRLLRPRKRISFQNYGYKIREFQLPVDGVVDYAQWL